MGIQEPRLGSSDRASQTVGRRLGGTAEWREEEGAAAGFEGDSMEIPTNEGVAGGDREGAREGRTWVMRESRRWPPWP
jgi:hypothetical protein